MLRCAAVWASCYPTAACKYLAAVGRVGLLVGVGIHIIAIKLEGFIWIAC